MPISHSDSVAEFLVAMSMSHVDGSAVVSREGRADVVVSSPAGASASAINGSVAGAASDCPIPLEQVQAPDCLLCDGLYP